MGPDLHGTQPQQAEREPERVPGLTVARIPQRFRRVRAGPGCDSVPCWRVPARRRFQGTMPNPASWTPPTGLGGTGGRANPLLRQAPRAAGSRQNMNMPVGPDQVCPDFGEFRLSGGLRQGTAHLRPRRHRTRRPRSGPRAVRTGSGRSHRYGTARRGRPAGYVAPSPPG